MRKLIILVCLIGVNLIISNAQPRPTRPERNTGTTSGGATEKPARGDLVSGVKAVEPLLEKPFIFTKGELQVGGDDTQNRKAFEAAIAKSDEVIKEFETEINNFLASNPSPFVYKNKLLSAVNRAKGLDSDIPLTEKEFKTGNSLGGVYYLQKLYLYQGFLKGATQIFPDSQPLKDYLAKVNEAINSYGSREKFMDKMLANQKEQVKNMRMIPAGMSNPKIEAMVKSRYEAVFSEFKVTKVNITYSTWLIEKNGLGIPLNRKLSVSVGVKNAKGECGIGSANVKEEYQGGGSYGEAFMYLPSDPIIVPCENLK